MKDNKTVIVATQDEELMSNVKNIIDLDFQRIDEKYFKQCPNISIDVCVMEKTNLGIVLPLNAGWNDIGSWDSVWEISKKDNNENVIELV